MCFCHRDRRGREDQQELREPDPAVDTTVPDLVEAIIGGWADQRVMLDMLERPSPMGWGSSGGRLPGHACLTSPLFVCPACLGPTALPGEMVDAVEGMGIIGERVAIGDRLHARLERWQACGSFSNRLG